jgi:hypothetical protein
VEGGQAVMKDCKVRIKELHSALKDLGEVGDVFEFKNGRITWKCGSESAFYNGIEDFNHRNGNIKIELVTEPQQFTKADLKTGMRVETRIGGIYIVIKNSKFDDFLANIGSGWERLEYYNNDLKMVDKNYSHADIVKIYDCPHESDFLNRNELGKLLWQRPEPKHYTISEAEARLAEIEGNPVKIVG